ncbi:MAG: Fe-S cluster assembly protein SufD [Chloroflexota bacterium]|nr:Fe-S cluster assembly protein SufD [Chloroflexota bacterium]MDE2918823.1 Fe-S cluster assembly protein SufD [Chloroflexota bacterium]
MTTTTPQAIADHSASHGEPVWLGERRAAAWRAYEDTPAPSWSDEEWRRTDTGWVDWAGVAPATNGADPARLALPEEIPNASVLMRQRGTSVNVLYTSPEATAAGVTVTSLATAAADEAATVSKLLATELAAPATGKLQAMNAALWAGGAFVQVPSGAELSAPIVIVIDAAGGPIFPRTLVAAGAGSSTDVLEWWRSSEDETPGFANGCVELFAGANARLSYTHVQAWDLETGGFLSQYAQVGRDAELATTNVTLGGRFHKGAVSATLTGPGANVRLNGVAYLDGRQFADHHTLQDHRTTDAASDLLYVNVLEGTSRSVYAGTIMVQPHAQRSNAYQQNRNLMLHRGPRADSIPRLEIMADDVRCTHGSTTSTIDPMHMYYLGSRGLDRDQARSLIVDGTFEPVLDRIPSETVRSAVRTAVRAKLHAGAAV